MLRTVTTRVPGLRRVRRPADEEYPEFDLTYVRTGPRTGGPPIVVIPGGPGLGSVIPYWWFRRRATRLGLDLIMIEHRGVGLSRNDPAGRDLPTSAMRVRHVVDDIVAVLDHEEVEQALLVGSSYGSYLVTCFGALHPVRVAGMLLDSALQSAGDIDIERQAVRALLWNADTELAAHVRRLRTEGVDERHLLDVARAAYELGGVELLGPVLRRKLRSGGGLVWRILKAYASRDESIVTVPGVYEFDLAGVIGFRELGYGSESDGLPLDPALTYAPLGSVFPPFEAELIDLHRAVHEFAWPLILLSGSRDLRTPPAIAARVADSAPNAVQLLIENGHSALETHPEALLAAVGALASGRHHELPQQSAALSNLPRRGITARVPGFLTALCAQRHRVRGYDGR